MAGELTKRVAVAAVGIPAAVGLIYLGGWVFGAVLALIAAGGALEAYKLAAAKGVRAFDAPGALAAAAFVLIAAGLPAAGRATPFFWLLTLVLLLGVSVAAIWLRGVAGQPLLAVTATVAGALLTGGTLAYALFLRHLPDEIARTGIGAAAAASPAVAGLALVFFPIGLTWTNDSLAYFTGRAWGKRKLIPKVSPGKTIVGSVAGITGTTLVGAAYAAFLELHAGLPVGLVAGAAGGALVSVAAQVGDLAESLFKRDAAVKDSGRIFPGHGGILDRFDALFFTLPITYWYLAWILGAVGSGPAWR